MNENALNLLGANQQVLLLAKENSPLILGRIIEHHKDRYLLMTSDLITTGVVSGKYHLHANESKDYPTVGDFVLVDMSSNFAVIHQLIPRSSMIERKMAGKKTDGQILAANVDYIFICQSVNENFNIRRLERYLSMAWSSGAIPVILLTKKDLTNQIEDYIIQTKSVALGVDIITCSDYQKDGFDELKNFLKKDKTYIFIGSSGVGKSTVVNHLINEQKLLTQDVGYKDRGRHTTTYKSLFSTSSGAIVIDTPGMRELQLDQADFDLSFSDIEELSKSCKFNDCTHQNEPGCAVLLSVKNKTLDLERLKSYHKLSRELEYIQKRQKYLEKIRSKKNR